MYLSLYFQKELFPEDGTGKLRMFRSLLKKNKKTNLYYAQKAVQKRGEDMNKRILAKGVALSMAASLVLFQVNPGIHSICAAGMVTEDAGNRTKEKKLVKRYEKHIPVIPLSADEVATENAIKKTNVDREHIIEKSKNKKQYFIKSDSSGTYQTVKQFCKGKYTEGTEEYNVLQEEQLLVADLSEEEVKELEGVSGVSVEVDALVDGSEAVEENSGELSDELQDAIVQVTDSAWNVDAVHAEQAEAGRDTIKIAVLDSGRDLYGAVPIEDSVNLIDPEINIYGMDMTGHGTSVESVIKTEEEANVNIGVANAEDTIEIYSVRILDENNQSPVSRVVEGIQWCMDNDINIINMSFGMDNYSAILEEAVNRAAEAGILMVAAAGNNGEEEYHEVQYPAGYAQVIGVGAVDEKMERSTFSAYGDGVEVVAPGENIPVSDSFQYRSVVRGTSFAAPHVSAIAALLWSQDAGRTAEEIRGVIQSSARYLGDPAQYGYGLADYTRAAEILEEYELPENSQEPGEIESNDTPVMEYEIPEVVKASWGKKLHQNLLSEFPSTLNKDIVLEFAIKPDDKYSTEESSNYQIFHAAGSTNYVAGTKSLYDLARLIKEGNCSKKSHATSLIEQEEGLDNKDIAAMKNLLKTSMIPHLVLKLIPVEF